ncbi:MAG: DUF3489 domain-containing protein [Amphiplicatus sp.]
MPVKSRSTKQQPTPAARSRKGAATDKPRNRTTSANPKGVKATTKLDESAAATKTDIILNLLRRKGGASVAEMADATGWQSHSVRGFLSGTVKKKLALPLAAENGEGAPRRYFIKAAS